MAISRPRTLGDDNARQQLTALAKYLAGTPDAALPVHLRDAQEALQMDEEAFTWFANLFQSLSGAREIVHWYTPHRLEGELTEHVVALAIGPADRSQEDASRFYRIAGGLLEENARQITDEKTLFERLAITLSWDLRDRVAPHIKEWQDAILDALQADLHERATTQQRHIRLLVKAAMSKLALASEPLIVAYLALGVSPAEAIAQAMSTVALPVPSQHE